MDVIYDNIKVNLIQSLGDDKTIVDSARVSFGDCAQDPNRDLSERDIKLLKFLLKNKHTSTLEHCFVTFRIECPLFVRSHIMRHRTFSYNEVSRRYTSKNINLFYHPSKLRKQSTSNLQCSSGDFDDPIAHKCLADLMRESVEKSVQAYESLIEGGVAREQARGILPQSLFTSFWMSGNLNNFIKFLVLRLDEHSQQETREVARRMRSLLAEKYPHTFSCLQELEVT